MNFKVLWRPLALEQLAPLLADPARQAAVLRAAFRVEALLEYFPDQVGESREYDERVIIEPPLTVYYEIDHAGEVVHVRRLLANLPKAPDSDD
jgi:hypothetical protein